MARRFRFNLEVIRRIRRREEEQQQRAVAVRVGHMMALEAELQRLRHEVAEQCRSKRDQQHAGPVDVDHLRRVQVYLGALRKAIEAGDARRAAMVEELNVERKKLAELVARRKVLDKLREKRWAAHRRGVMKAEQLEMDEIAAQPFANGTVRRNVWDLRRKAP